MSETAMLARPPGAAKTAVTNPESVFGTEQKLARIVSAFESCTLPRADWTHVTHLAVAAWYLTRFPEQQAAQRMIDGIKRYNCASGSNGYHETITRFWLATICKHLNTCTAQSPFECVIDVIETFGERKDLMFDYYSRDRILSAEARREWVEPDLRALDV